MTHGGSVIPTNGRDAQSDVALATRAGEPRARDAVLALLSLALVIGAYFIWRYGGRWAESDTAVMTGAIRVVADSAALAPQASGVYVNGYGYQVVSTTIVAFTGLSVETLQVMVYPLISAVLVLPAWILYRELTGSARLATLATLLLWLVPEHLFAVLRGSHERLDRAFLLTALWLLVRTVRFGGDRQRLVAHVALVLLMLYGLIATNALFGMSFVAALVSAFVMSILAMRGPAVVRPYAIQTTRLLGWRVRPACCSSPSSSSSCIHHSGRASRPLWRSRGSSWRSS